MFTVASGNAPGNGIHQPLTPQALHIRNQGTRQSSRRVESLSGISWRPGHEPDRALWNPERRSATPAALSSNSRPVPSKGNFPTSVCRQIDHCPSNGWHFASGRVKISPDAEEFRHAATTGFHARRLFSDLICVVNMPNTTQYLDLRGILDQSVNICKEHFGVLFRIVLMISLPFGVIDGLISLENTPVAPPNGTIEESQTAHELQSQAMWQHWPISAATFAFGMFLVYPLTNGALIQAAAQLYQRKSVTTAEAMKHAFVRLVPLVWTNILTMLAVFGGILLLIIPGIYFAIWFGLSQQVVVLEDLRGPAALGRSKRLIHQERGKFLALALIVFGISFGVNLAASFIPQPVLLVFVRALLQGVTAILWAVASVVFYYSCLSARAGTNLHTLAVAIR
jgi:hypothetical protein